MIKTLSIFIISFLLSCRGIRTLPREYAAYQEKERSHMLAIFMDGTMDMPHKKNWWNSHVKKIHSLALPGIKSLYVEGVGAGNRYIQGAKAWTTKKRMMRAYRFLAENYEKDDSICLFGFSRGANQCRILSGFIYTIGIINLDKIKKEYKKNKLLLGLFRLYFKTTGEGNKKNKLLKFVNDWNIRHPDQKVDYDISGNTMIELMGLWDTVEALKTGDRLETPTPIPQHLNQLYNVKKLFHVVSLDDNRAFNYTPILATHKEVALHPYQVLDSIVEEVWFNGCHKDVGGGIREKKKDQLSGITITWMMSRVAPYHIFRDSIFEINTYGKVNDMRSILFYRLTSPGDTLRGINKYWDSMNPGWNKHRIKIHQSVIDRLAAGTVQDFKTKNGRTDWYDWDPFKQCFTAEGKKRIFLKDCPCIEVVND